MREGSLTASEGQQFMDLFRTHVEDDVWNLRPITESILRTTATLVRGLPGNVPLRAGDALHIATALDAGEKEIWTNDRHLLGACGHFGLVGRTA
jgi:predicted nucleic acid-binding protein